MRIKYVKCAAGPDGIFHPGHVADVTKSKASPLIKGGFAVEVEDAQRTLESSLDNRRDAGAPVFGSGEVAPSDLA